MIFVSNTKSNKYIPYGYILYFEPLWVSWIDFIRNMEVITSVMKCWMKSFIHSKMVQPLKYGNR